ISYKARQRNYNEVLRTMDGVNDPSTLGLLTQDAGMSNYFSAEVGNWSDDPMHQAAVTVVDGAGNPNTIPQTNTSGDFMWRIGKSDPSVTNELRDMTTEVEFKQGGIRFTSA